MIMKEKLLEIQRKRKEDFKRYQLKIKDFQKKSQDQAKRTDIWVTKAAEYKRKTEEYYVSNRYLCNQIESTEKACEQR